MRDLQACATLIHPRPRTRNEQVSGSSPLVGSLVWSSFAGETLIKQVRAVFRPALLTTTQPKKRALRLTLERVDLGSHLILAANQKLGFCREKTSRRGARDDGANVYCNLVTVMRTWSVTLLIVGTLKKVSLFALTARITH